MTTRMQSFRAADGAVRLYRRSVNQRVGRSIPSRRTLRRANVLSRDIVHTCVSWWFTVAVDSWEGFALTRLRGWGTVLAEGVMAGTLRVAFSLR